MGVVVLPVAEALARLDGYAQVIDARSPAEYAADRLPGAVNWPVLDDAERALVGTEYAQVSPFEARKRGAALVARNIAALIERHLADTPRDWQPLVYCWRGGQRSGALALVLGQIGFRVAQLEGGYQAFRRAVVAGIDALAPPLALRVIGGPTGSGKSRLLQALAAEGAQVLDLEALARHRGSVLGGLPGDAQPTQKAFETALWCVLRRLDPARPVWVESESRRIGALRVPGALIEAMHRAPCLQVEMPRAARVALLMADYAHFVQDTAAFCARLDALRELRGHARIDGWQAAARAGRLAEVVDELLEVHYDPGYAASSRRHFARLGEAARVRLDDGSPASLAAAARRLHAGG
ncbi:tRNA 2-selenouridine(34) synthase MnmH [Piscinibacter sakaiensis]|uniref:Selenophosphate-dependent tRNA 2-selenouridine synthase n=1 Tax=Piscinibacter sakaiensis TaxID=1547922 RepID=A0A0K8NVZ2_PISS1|nr:tRNA 2-selenouridine(34) synthase MnmH [Piscinibacter sakaiensis]GAP34567.1 selenophosphate-dependent tRNA 2-selenouridine synthase [Piscinibacter sakaiensis]